ncbi:MAG: hypothetical protein ACT6FF_09535 [Methanosarcinaceae archaeon]
MAKYKTKTIEASLSKKGFREINTHHKCHIYYVNEEKTGITTFISHGINEYGDILLSKMRTQLKLSREQFDGLVMCSLTKEELYKIYSDNDLI